MVGTYSRRYDYTGLQAWGKRGLDDALYRRVTHTDPAAVRDFFYLTDSQFSVRALIGSGGRARPYETLRYDAYGTPTHRYPEDLDDNGTLNIFDATAFLAHHTASDMRADLDYNGLLNFFDTQIPTWAVSYKTSLPPGALSDWGAEGPDNRIGYAGYVWDHEVGMWLGRHRVYDPAAGRWMQRDPAGYVDGLSMYLFVRGNPLSFIDPMGLQAEGVWGWVSKILGIGGDSRTGSHDCDRATRSSPAEKPSVGMDSLVDTKEKREALQQDIVETAEQVADLTYAYVGLLPGGALAEGAYIYHTQGPQAAAQFGATTGGVSLVLGGGGTLAAKAGGLIPGGRILTAAADTLDSSIRSSAVPNLKISASRYPDLAENIRQAQAAGHPQVLTHGGNPGTNRSAALRDVPNVRPLSRDEYPFASSAEGGAGSWVGHIPRSQQNAQGGILSRFLREHNIQSGDRYRVTVEP